VLPVLAASQHGEPIEEIRFVRDEVANLVWAVECTVPSLAGGAIDRQARHRLSETPPVDASDDALRHRIASAIPPHWVPFQPSRIDPDLPDIRLLRAAALLDNTDSGPTLARPLGRGLEPQSTDLTLFEEEVPSTGRYQFARGPGGQSHLWLARNKDPRPADRVRYDAIN
jgi:hypothetical protein